MARLWPAWFDRPDAQPRWAWKLMGLSVALLVVATAFTILTGVAVLISLAFR
jgi:hypothetical protein